MLLIVVPEPLNQRVLEKTISVLFVWPIQQCCRTWPPHRVWMRSWPSPSPAERAQGLIKQLRGTRPNQLGQGYRPTP
jgi:hypothetical protein